MLVRSQDNEKITDRIEFSIVEVPVKGYWGIYQPEPYRLFGEYSTFEKAVKALNMLELAYGRKCTSHIMPKETMIDAINTLVCAGVEPDKAVDNIANGYVKAHLFQFPAEEEIEDEE